MKRYNNYLHARSKPVVGNKLSETNWKSDVVIFRSEAFGLPEVGTPAATEGMTGEEIFGSIDDNSSSVQPEAGNLQLATTGLKFLKRRKNTHYSILSTQY